MVVFLCAIALIVSFDPSVFFAGVAAISSPFLILGGIGAVGTYFVLMASFTFSGALAGLAVFSAPFMLMARFAASAFLAGLAAISSALLYRAFLYLFGNLSRTSWVS